MFAQLGTLVLAATTAFAVPTRRANGTCDGYRPVSEVFSIGTISQQYIMDVTDTTAWDYNTTKIYYQEFCDPKVEVREIAFVVRLFLGSSPSCS
jgi:hypothetical protein